MHDGAKNVATFIKVAFAAAILFVIVREDIRAELSYTEHARQGFYERGADNAGF